MSNIVGFKSIPENWKKEHDGLKPNTLRKVDGDDPRFDQLRHGSAKKIRIINTETSDNFVRTITDITFWEGWVIISWKHPNSKGLKIDKRELQFIDDCITGAREELQEAEEELSVIWKKNRLPRE